MPSIVGYLLADSDLNRLPRTIFRSIVFYAPLIGNLKLPIGRGDITFTRASTDSATYRDLQSHSVAVDEPRFNWQSAAIPLGIGFDSAKSESLSFAPSNNLDDLSTLVWFEDNVYKHTPTDSNPIDASGNWVGNNADIKKLTKFNRTLATSEIQIVGNVFTDTDPPVVSTPSADTGVWNIEQAAGAKPGNTFTITNSPDLNTLTVLLRRSTPSGPGMYLYRVASAPGVAEYSISGTTITTGDEVQTYEDLIVQYRNV